MDRDVWLRTTPSDPDRAAEHAQEDRIVLFDRLIKDIDGDP
jgi:hypothetical protein